MLVLNQNISDKINCVSIGDLRFFLNRETKLEMINSAGQIISRVEYISNMFKINGTTASSFRLTFYISVSFNLYYCHSGYLNI
jgi:hypothetical protein